MICEGHADHSGDIRFTNFTPLELGLQPRRNSPRFRKHHDSRGVGIEAMRVTRPERGKGLPHEIFVIETRGDFQVSRQFFPVMSWPGGPSGAALKPQGPPSRQTSAPSGPASAQRRRNGRTSKVTAQEEIVRQAATYQKNSIANSCAIRTTYFSTGTIQTDVGIERYYGKNRGLKSQFQSGYRFCNDF
jgi:hypothetical protein